MRKICVFNSDPESKLTLNIFAKFARLGRRILVVDLRYNKQANRNKLDVGLNIKTCIQEKNGINKYISSLEKNLDIIKGEESLNLEEFGMFKEFFSMDYFIKKFKKENYYDYIILELSPNLTFLNMNALFFADEVVTFANLEKSGITFAYKISKFVKNFNRFYENKIFISKIIPTYKDTFEKEKLVYLISNFSSKMVVYPISEVKKHVDFKNSLSQICDSIIDDEKLLSLKLESNERQKFITEFLDILPDK